jgi:hypothetical protein
LSFQAEVPVSISNIGLSGLESKILFLSLSQTLLPPKALMVRNGLKTLMTKWALVYKFIVGCCVRLILKSHSQSREALL